MAENKLISNTDAELLVLGKSLAINNELINRPSHIQTFNFFGFSSLSFENETKKQFFPAGQER